MNMKHGVCVGSSGIGSLKSGRSTLAVFLAVMAVSWLTSPSAVWAQESPPGCEDSAVSVGINPTPSGPVQHGTQICYTICYGSQGAPLPCDIVNFNSTLVLPNGVTETVTTNASIGANTSFCCPSADARCVLQAPDNCYTVSHDDEVASFNGCPPVTSGDSGRVVAYTFGEGDTLTLLGDAVAPCATANNIIAHGSCCEPCSDDCVSEVTCNECPGDSIFTLGGTCSGSCLLTCGDADACTTDGVCVPGSGRDNCATTPGGTTATCSPDVHFCVDPPIGFTCDDANVCTTDICLDDADPSNPCCDNVPIVCPSLPCQRNIGCDPVLGCQYTFDCREPAAPGEVCCPDDGNPCTVESCDAATGLCVTTPECTLAAECDDSNVCTADSCEDSCCVNTEIPCPDVPCFRIVGCDPVSGCIYESICSFDPDFCEDNNVCTTDTCDDSVTGCCIYTPITCPPIVCERNVSCDPILGCQYVDDCRNGPLGTCCPDDGNPCTTEFCDAATGICGFTPDCTGPADCDDNNLCTVDTCENSCCVNTPVVCPEIPCKRLTGCDPIAGCQYVDDCRTGPLGTCCPDDGNPCTTESCDPATGVCGVEPECAIDADCDDNNACTTDACEGSCCVYGPITCLAPICQRVVGCDPVTGCIFEVIEPCCGNNIVEEGESCDPPGSAGPNGEICTEQCQYCGDGILSEGEECDPGNPGLGIPPIECISHEKPCKETICDDCKCVKVNFPNGTVVNTGNECMDLVCQNGMPFEQPRPNGTACGEAVSQGTCDAPDSCDGMGHCNQNISSGDVVCRAAAGPCDVAERCTGVNPSCPADLFAPAGTLAPDDGAECTYDVCNAQGQAIHPPKAAGTPCGNPLQGICDLPDTCNGAGECNMNLVSTGNNTCMATRMAKVSECIRGPNVPYPHFTCFTVDMDNDGDVDLADCGE